MLLVAVALAKTLPYAESQGSHVSSADVAFAGLTERKDSQGGRHRDDGEEPLLLAL